ncbi:uncharacterized protein [Diadema setosum]|uniref:uncharacterized protein n=1 Tax=Diadema setosum TaxID=31175 RepID=UPI003B3A92D1
MSDSEGTDVDNPDSCLLRDISVSDEGTDIDEMYVRYYRESGSSTYGSPTAKRPREQVLNLTKGRAGPSTQSTRGDKRERGTRRRGRVERGKKAERDGEESDVGEAKKCQRSRKRVTKRRPCIRTEKTSDEERIKALRDDRKKRIKEEISKMTKAEMEDLLLKTAERRPGLVFDLLHHPPPQQQPPSDVPWCTCGNCHEMPSDAERLCCGARSKEECLSRHGIFFLLIDEAVLLIHRSMWKDAFNMEDEPQEPGDEDKCMRHAAYRSFIFWQHGRLGKGNRRVIPSCCVTEIRNRYPSPTRIYTGYVPGRWV